jgi:hypothetical protein
VWAFNLAPSFPRGALTRCPQLCMGISFTQAIYRNRPIENDDSNPGRCCEPPSCEGAKAMSAIKEKEEEVIRAQERAEAEHLKAEKATVLIKVGGHGLGRQSFRQFRQFQNAGVFRELWALFRRF